MRRDRVRKPVSKLEKVLHFDRGYKREDVANVLGIGGKEYEAIMLTPWKNVKLEMLGKLAVLLEMNVIEVFWICYRQNIVSLEDERKLEAMLIVDRLNLR